jgi:hypothetical protein
MWNVVSRFIQIYPNRKEAAACNQKVYTRVSQIKTKKVNSIIYRERRWWLLLLYSPWGQNNILCTQVKSKSFVVVVVVVNDAGRPAYYVVI